MQVFIPTYGRASSQTTYAALKGAGVAVTLVVQHRERDLYGAYPHVVLPPHIQTIAPTRQYILDNLLKQDKFVMVDDDLHFYHRRTDDPTKLRDITPLELANAFADIDFCLTPTCPHVGFAPREGANRNPTQYVPDTRIMRVLGYYAPVLRKHGVRFDDMEVMEDFHVALGLLKRGYHNMVLNTYAHNQASGSGAKGGCSHFRTPALHAHNAHLLAELHPGLVKVVTKETKGAWGGGTRTDVVVQWKKALKAIK